MILLAGMAVGACIGAIVMGLWCRWKTEVPLRAELAHWQDRAHACEVRYGETKSAADRAMEALGYADDYETPDD